jgi:hypothetical protein
LSFAADDFAGLHLPDRSQRERIRTVERTGVSDGWVPPTVEWELDIGRPLADYTTVDLLDALTEDAYGRLKHLLDGRVEALPLNVIKGPPAVALNVTRRLDDVLDEARSVIKRFPDSERIMRIKRAEFRPERLEGETIFKLAIHPTGPVYVTDAFVEAAQRENITGMRLEPVWPTDDAAAEAEGERMYGRLVPGPEDIGPPQELVAHHIIPPLEIDSPELERTQAHAQALGIDPDEAANGVWLSRERHERAYTDTYFKQLWERFKDARTREEGVEVLAGIAQDLEAGRFPRAD